MSASADHFEPLRTRRPLMSEVVEREHRGNFGGDRGQCGRRMPIVQVDDIRTGRLDEPGDGSGESKESFSVVEPTPSIRLQVRVTSSDAGHLNEMDTAGDGMLSDSNRTRPRPVREFEVEALLIREHDSPIIREKDIDLDPGATECADEAARGGGETADGGERRQFGGGEGDAHMVIVVDD